MKTIIANTKGLSKNYIRTASIARANAQKPHSRDCFRFTYPSLGTACNCIAPTGRGVVVTQIHSQNENIKQDTSMKINALPLYK